MEIYVSPEDAEQVISISKSFNIEAQIVGHIEEGKKSVALHIVYQASDRTLKEEDIAPVHERILKQFKEKLGAELRS